MEKTASTAVVWKESEGYVSKCSELGVAGCGDSYDHAVSNLREAVELYLENAKALDLLEDIEASLTTKEKFTTQLLPPGCPTAGFSLRPE